MKLNLLGALAAAGLCLATLGAASAQSDPQSRDAILEAFDVDIKKLPKGSDVTRVPGQNGESDQLLLQVPAKISTSWAAPSQTSASCDITLTFVRTGKTTGQNGQPPHSQHLYSSGTITHWAGAFYMPIRDGKPQTGKPGVWPEEGYPAGLAGDGVLIPAPTCDASNELGYTITPNDPPYKEQEKEYRERGLPDAQIQQALKMMTQIGGRSANPYARTVPWNEFVRLTCYSRYFPVTQIVDGRPESFVLKFEGRLEHEDEPACPLTAAKGYIHVGDPPEEETFAFIKAFPEPETHFKPDGSAFACTNNDPVNPLVQFDFTTDIKASTIARSVTLEIETGPDSYQPVNAPFEVLNDTSLIMSPGTRLEPLRRYRVRVAGGEAGLTGYGKKDILPEDLELEFQTAPAEAGVLLDSVFRRDVDLGIYQVVRDQPVLPGKETFARTYLPYPSSNLGNEPKKLAPNMCLDVSVRSEATGNLPEIGFTETSYVATRADLITKEDRRLGYNKALSQGWVPRPQEGGSDGRRLFAAKITPANFTSAIEGAEPPSTEIEADRPTEILNQPIRLPIKVYAARVNIDAIDDAIAALFPDQISTDGELQGDEAKPDPARTLTSIADYLRASNEKTPQLAREVIARGSVISETLSDYLPVNSASMQNGGNVNIGIWLNTQAFVRGAVGISADEINKTIVNQFAAAHENQVLPNCRGLEICTLVVPWRWGGAKASTNNALRARGLILGVDTLEPKIMERIGLAFAHEIGHDFGLAHVPNDFDKEEEQTRINNQLSRQDILWPDIDAMFRRSDGTIVYRSSKDGNSEHSSLYPMMYHVLVRPYNSALPDDQYQQILKALRAPYSGNPQYYGPYAEGSESSKFRLELFNWRKTNSLYQAGARAQEIFPVLRYNYPALEEQEDAETGLSVSLSLLATDAGWLAPLNPIVMKGWTLPASVELEDGAADVLQLRALDKAGKVIAAQDFDLPATAQDGRLRAFRLEAALSMSAADLEQVATLEVLSGTQELIARMPSEAFAARAAAAEPVEDEPIDADRLGPATEPQGAEPVISEAKPKPASPKKDRSQDETIAKAPEAASSAQGGSFGSCGMSRADIAALVDHQMAGLEGLSGVGNVEQLKKELLESYLAEDYPKDVLCEMRKEME